MRTLDIKLYETGNGGDIRVVGNDLEGVAGFDNMPYMLLFGGNTIGIDGEQMTSTGDVDEKRLDWVGNRIVPNDAVSITELRLMEVSLNSEGRQLIENAVRADLRPMESFANVTVSVRVISDDKILILITLIRPDVLENKQFQFIWDATLGRVLGADGYTPPQDVTLNTNARITDLGDSRIINTGLNRLI